MFDTWELRNQSALPIKLTSVTACGRFDDVALTPDNETRHGITLTFDDAQLETLRGENARSWKGMEVPPGDTIQAVVPINTSLRVKYRRTGATGVFERRKLSIHGYV